MGGGRLGLEQRGAGWVSHPLGPWGGKADGLATWRAWEGTGVPWGLVFPHLRACHCRLDRGSQPREFTCGRRIWVRSFQALGYLDLS